MDLIVTDIVMPGEMSGVDLAHAIRQAFANIPVVVISGYPSPQNKRPVGDFQFISKPFNPDTILNVVRKLLAPD